MLKSPISILQEIAMQRKLALPDYQCTGSGQSHSMSFTCSVKMDNETAVGEGSNKRDAKHAAALKLLEKLGIKREGTQEVSTICLLPTQPKVALPVINFIGKINEFSSKKRIPQPIYSEKCLVLDGQFCIICEFHQLKTEGKGLTKKEAKQNAAKEMWLLIKESEIDYNDLAQSSQINGSIEESNDKIEKVLKVYTDIMRNMSITSEPLNNNNNTSHPEIINISNWSELILYMNDRGWLHDVTVFQVNPLMLCLKINEHTLINYGKTHEEILMKFVKSVVNMLQEGIDFSDPLITV